MIETKDQKGCSINARQKLIDIEIKMIREALKKNNGNITHAATYLSMPRVTLMTKMRRLNIVVEKGTDAKAQGSAE